MSYQQILYEVKDRIATISLNRPEKLNAYTGTMGEEIYDAFRRSVSDDQVGAIIVTGSGRGFCAGIDLGILGDPAEQAKISSGAFLRKFPVENYHCPKPTLCAINGAAFGVGVTMAVSFDLRIAAEDAKLAVPFAKLGMLAGLGSSHLLPRLIGRGRALDLLLSARTISAAEAYEIGLVERVVPAGQALAAARELAATMASYDPLVLAHLKQSLNLSAAVTSVEQAIENEGKVMAALRSAKAARDGN